MGLLRTFDEVEKLCMEKQVDRVSPRNANKNILYKCLVENCDFSVQILRTHNKMFNIMTESSHNHSLSKKWTPIKTKPTMRQKMVCLKKVFKKFSFLMRTYGSG